jgi:hypothetical protein
LPQNFEGNLFVFSLYTPSSARPIKSFAALLWYNAARSLFESIALINDSKLKDISLAMHHQGEFAMIVEYFAGGKTTNKNDQRSS